MLKMIKQIRNGVLTLAGIAGVIALPTTGARISDVQFAPSSPHLLLALPTVWNRTLFITELPAGHVA